MTITLLLIFYVLSCITPWYVVYKDCKEGYPPDAGDVFITFFPVINTVVTCIYMGQAVEMFGYPKRILHWIFRYKQK